MRDAILDAFLKRQHAEGVALAASSDVLDLDLFDGRSLDRYVASFHCAGLVRDETGAVVEATGFTVGIWFPPNYLLNVNPASVVTWFGPTTVFHPNIAPPFICVGRIAPGTPLIDLLYQCFEIFTYTKVTMREDDALNPQACVWARQNQHRFPADRRPLKRRALRLETGPIEKERPE